MTYRERLLRWKHAKEISGNRIVLRELAARCGVSHTVLQRLLTGKQTKFKGETLAKIGVGIGEGADFFFRETDPAAPAPAPTPGRCAFTSADDAKEILGRFYKHIGPDHCQTFTIICDCRNGKGARVLAVVDGEVVYVGPDRHRGNSA